MKLRIRWPQSEFRTPDSTFITAQSMPTATLTTADSPGAVALIQLHGDGALDAMHRLTGREDPADGRLRLRDLGGIDEGLVAAPRHDWVQLMPHGGPRVVALLLDRLSELGTTYDPEPEPRTLYPEAGSAIEAGVLAAIARAASPAAIDLLAAQPALWRAWLEDPTPQAPNPTPHLDRLLLPPTVVVIGRPNVGKSTLANAVLGRGVSLVSDLPGATRDWVGGLTELPGGIAVRWLDTPGLRDSDDAVEQHAIALARRVIADADVLIAMRDRETDWPDASSGLPREPDVWVMNKCDDPKPPRTDTRGHGTAREQPLRISAEKQINLGPLLGAIVARLGLDDLSPDAPWPFSPTLRRSVEARDHEAIKRYAQRD